MIKELTVKNFQIHKERTIEFTKGLNVIIGDTDVGKSALVRSLYLLIMNQPRSGEKIFQNKFTKDPLEVQIKDESGNCIKRTKRNYYMNNNQMKAFGTDIPEPVVELFPFKDINWQKQLEQHFLILQTGGGAAKILNNSTGMQDQETLIKEVKTKISKHKSNVKRLIKNNQEYKETVDELKYVNLFLEKAKKIKILYNENKLFDSDILKLDTIINELNFVHYDIDKLIVIRPIIKKVKSIEKLQIQFNELKQTAFELNDIILQLKNVRKYSKYEKIYNKLIKSIIFVQGTEGVKEKVKFDINLLSHTIKEIKKAQKDYKKSKAEHGLYEKQFSKKLVEVGECPLCGTKFNGEKHTC